MLAVLLEHPSSTRMHPYAPISIHMPPLRTHMAIVCTCFAQQVKQMRNAMRCTTMHYYITIHCKHGIASCSEGSVRFQSHIANTSTTIRHKHPTYKLIQTVLWFWWVWLSDSLLPDECGALSDRGQHTAADCLSCSVSSPSTLETLDRHISCATYLQNTCITTTRHDTSLFMV